MAFDVGDALTIRRPHERTDLIFSRAELLRLISSGYLMRVRPIRAHDPELALPVRRGHKCDARSVRGHHALIRIVDELSRAATKRRKLPETWRLHWSFKPRDQQMSTVREPAVGLGDEVLRHSPAACLAGCDDAQIQPGWIGVGKILAVGRNDSRSDRSLWGIGRDSLFGTRLIRRQPTMEQPEQPCPHCSA